MGGNTVEHKGKGHLYLAFGADYDNVAAHSVKALRRFSQLPVHVVTNLSEEARQPLWHELQDVTFQQLPSGLHDRQVKTSLVKYTPFEQTLYTDGDTVIHSERFLEAFDVLKMCDIAFPYHTDKESAWRIRTDIYKQAVNDFNVTQSNMRVLQGGLCVFKRNDASRTFFALWNKYWNFRKLRDMPPLMAAAYNVNDVAIGILSKDFGFPDSKIIQHFYGWKPPKTNLLPQFQKTVVNETKGQWELRKCFR